MLRKLSEATLNFLVASLYTSLGDITFFSVLEVQSLSLGSIWSGISLAICIACIVLTLCLFSAHLMFLLKYRALKTKASSDSDEKFHNFTKRYGNLRVLYEDFSDASLFKHGFLIVLVVRNIMISITITTLLQYPLVQTILLTCFSLMMCAYLLVCNPFTSWQDRVTQMFLEFLVLAVYICIFMLALLDFQHRRAIIRERLSLANIIVNIILNIMCSCLMGLKLL